MSCANPLRLLYFECQTPILDRFGVGANKRFTFNNVSYLGLKIAPGEYTRVLEGEKSMLVEAATRGRVFPRTLRCGFSLQISDINFSVSSCLEYLATSSLTTEHTQYIPITVLDFVRPEVKDYSTTGNSYTTRKGILYTESMQGTTGYNNAEKLDSGFSLKFMEIDKRLVI